MAAAISGHVPKGASVREAAIGEFAVKLTLSPASRRKEDLAPLLAAGLEDSAISDLVQVIAYFNYINRVADGLGVDLEPGMPPHRTEDETSSSHP